MVERHGGEFPDDLEALRALPGIGDYTAAAVGAIAFDAAAVPVDGNVERVVTRLFAVEEALPAAKPAIKRLATSMKPLRRTGDFCAGAHGSRGYTCSPKKPACALCPWNEPCVARALGRQEDFPRKTAKREGRLRRGAAFVALRADQCVLLRTRPDKGLLAKMTEVPGSAWSHDFDAADALAAAPFEAAWRKLPGVVNYVFTHFPLELTVFTARVPARTRAPKGARWVKLADTHQEALPTLMRKVLEHALDRHPAKGVTAGDGWRSGSTTRWSRTKTASETYSSMPCRVRVPSPCSPVMMAVTPLSFNQRKRRRNSARRMNSLENPANRASTVSNTTRLAPTESMACPRRMKRPSRS